MEVESVWGEGLVLYQMAIVYEAANKNRLLVNAPVELKSYLPSVDRVRQEMKNCLLEALEKFRKIDHYLGISLAANEIAAGIKDDSKTFW